MATIGTIAVNLTADARPLQGGLAVAKRSLDEFDRSASRMRGSSMNASMAFLELSRGVEDAKVGFDTNGLQGAIRGSLNNLAQLAMYMGGPMTAALTTFAAVGLSTVITHLMGTSKGAKEATDSLKDFKEQLDEVRDAAKQQADFQTEMAGAKSGEEIKKQIEEREALVRAIDKQNAALQEQRMIEQRSRKQVPVWVGGGLAGIAGGGPLGFLPKRIMGPDEASIARDKEIHKEQMKLLKERAAAEEEIVKLRERMPQLGNAKDLDNLNKEIEKMQAARRKRAEAEGRGVEGGIQLLQGQAQKFAPRMAEEFERSMQIDKILSAPISNAMREQMQSLLNDGLLELKPTKSDMFAKSDEIGTSAEFKSVFAANELARQQAADDQRAQRIIDVIQKATEELKAIKKNTEDDNSLLGEA